MRYGMKKRNRTAFIALAIVSVLLLYSYILQTSWAHRKGRFIPTYPTVTLTEQTDYQTIFQQTGLGKVAFESLLRKGDFETVLEMQKQFFYSPNETCKSTFGWFTKSDRISKENAPTFVDLQPGDIILTLSTHSLGWRHGHAGLVVDEKSVLECLVIGQDSCIASVRHWSTYSQVAVLRIKGITKELQQQIVAYAKENLCGVPYCLWAGFGKNKAPHIEDEGVGLQCAYLVWYAYQHFGYDLDSDGGRLVTTGDLLHSDCLEVVQIYGMNPNDFPLQ